jgi:hypothetical protein
VGYAQLRTIGPQRCTTALTDELGDAMDRGAVLSNVEVYRPDRAAGSSARRYRDSARALAQPARPCSVPTFVAVLSAIGPSSIAANVSPR